DLLDDVAVDVGGDRLEDFGRVAHEHGEARCSTACTTKSFRARDVTRDCGKLIRNLRKFLIYTKEFLCVAVDIEEADRRLPVGAGHGVGDDPPALPRKHVLAALIVGEAVLVDDDLRPAGDAEV